MIDNYITVKEAAEKWNLKNRAVQAMCMDGRIPGAVKFGKNWAIPVETERPKDKREKTGKYKGWRKNSPKGRAVKTVK